MLVLLPFLHFFVALALAAGLNWLALIPWRRSTAEHWTERARRLYPLRLAAGANLFFIPACCVAAQAALLPRLPYSTLWLALPALPGVILGMYPMDREIFAHLTFRGWLHEVGAAWVLRLSRILVFIGAMFLMPLEWDWRVPVIALGVVAIQVWLVWGGGLWLARKLGLVVEAPERLLRIVDDVAQRLDVPLPRTWMLRGLATNALALPHTHTLVVTERLVELVPDDELTAICAHEFGHLTESRRVLAVRFLGALALLPWLFVRPMTHSFGLPSIFFLALIGWVLARALRGFAQRMEHRADAIAVAHEGEESGAYARALARIYEANQIPAVMPGKRQIHPHLYDRLLAAGMTPDFPRPKAASARGWPSMVVSAAMFTCIFVAAFRHANDDRPSRRKHRSHQAAPVRNADEPVGEER